MTNEAIDFGEELFPDMIEECTKRFVPQVQALTDMSVDEMKDSKRFKIEFIETMFSGLMFEMQINIDDLDIWGLKVLLHNLTALTCWAPSTPDMQGINLHGYRFEMGDGDDTGAVYMRNGKLCVWVRGWPRQSDDAAEYERVFGIPL
jgi:hypothetical protein